MGGTTTAFPTQTKKDLMSSLHCFNATVAPTGDTTNTAFTIANVSSLVGLAVGMAVSGTGIPAGTVLASIDSATGITLSKAATATNATTALTFTGDVFKLALVKVTPTGTYDATTTKYADLTGNTDETSGTGYTAGGVTLSANQTPISSGTTAYTQPTTNPSWTSATFSTIGAIMYNSTRRGPVANPASGVFDFGGTQTVSAGTLTLLLPTYNNTNALLRLA